MSYLDRITDDMSGLEKLAAKIPGYKGYKQRELRREADKLLRDYLATQLQIVKGQLTALQQEMVEARKYDLLDEAESAATQLQTFIDRVKHATYGYAGVFDAVKILEDDLARVYDFDAALVNYVDRISGAVSRAREGLEGEDARSLVVMIRELGREANATFDERTHVLRGTAE